MLRLQLRGVGIRELDASPLAAVLDDGVTPIDLLDIEHVAYLSPKGGPRVRWRVPGRAHDPLARPRALLPLFLPRAVEALSPRLEREPLVLGLDERLHLLQVVALDVDR